MRRYHLSAKTDATVRLRKTSLLVGALIALAVLGTADRAWAQAQLADDIVIISKGLREQEKERGSHLGEAPGAGGSRLPVAPGSGAPQLGEAALAQSVTQRDILSAAAGPPQGLRAGPEPLITPPSSLIPAELPQFGFLELPTTEDEGPEDGLSLDISIERLVNANYDLRIKYQEIPKADADVLTAGLRGNPLVFASADNVPYGGYSPERPGENGYGVTVIQPVDINHKRDMRIAVARQAKRVLEAQYQNAVRLEIDNLYTAFINVLAARETVRYLEASIAGLDEVIGVVEQQLKGKQISVTTLSRLQIQRKSAALAQIEAQATHVKAKHSLAMLLNLSIIDDDRFAIRAQLLDPRQELPALDDLTGIALANRPDLVAYRLGVQRAQTDVGLAEREAFPDVFVLYTPWALRNNEPTGGQNATSWSVGAMFAVPVFNKNQGNIRRAQINVSQTRTELTGLERKVETEVHAAYRDALTARSTVQQIESEILPTARTIQDQTLRLFKVGEVSAVEYLNAVREYSEVVRQYRDALVNKRRADLRLNTVIALRVIF